MVDPSHSSGSLSVNLGVLAVTCLLCFAGTELWVRHAVRHDGRPPLSRRVDVFENGAWKTVGVWGTGVLKQPGRVPSTENVGEYRPNLTFRFVYSELSKLDREGQPVWKIKEVVHHTNSEGLRGPTPHAKNPAVMRILILGDSFTFGDGVPDGYTFSDQLERNLGPGYETINAGVSGYNTRHEVAWLKHRGLALEPDIVLIVFYLNDAYDDARFGLLIAGGADGAKFGRQPPSDSALWSIRWLSNMYRRYRDSRAVTQMYRSQFTNQPAIDGHDWHDSQEALRHARELTTKHGIALGLVIFPELYDLTDDHLFADIYEQVAAHATSLGIPVLNLLDTFKGESPRSLWVHVSDHHPNQKAHALAAGALTPFVRSLIRARY